MALLEIELKFPAPANFAEHVAALGAVQAGTHLESDHYFNAPDRDFAITNEAFRIRRIGEDLRFTYKGPRQPGPAKTRTEIEVSLGGTFENAAALVAGLGYRSVAIVEKRRESWTLAREGYAITLTRDEVKTVGTFVEVEIVAAEADKAPAEAVLLKLCAELGLQTPEPRSYLRMTLERATQARS